MSQSIDQRLVELAGINALETNNADVQRSLKCLKYLVTQLRGIAHSDEEQRDHVNGILKSAHNILFSGK